jgi:hypothetical protein
LRDIVNVLHPPHLRPVPAEHLEAERIFLHLPDAAHARPLQAQAESADAREQVQESQQRKPPQMLFTSMGASAFSHFVNLDRFHLSG